MAEKVPRIFLNNHTTLSKNTVSIAESETEILHSGFFLISRIFSDVEEGLRVAADELFREESGTKPEESKILIVFSDGGFGGFYLVSLF